MRDLTDRALDTATALGASYADVRVVRRLEESIAIKTGRVEGVASGESEGFGVRVLVDGAWGFASVARPDRRRGRPGRRRGRPDRPGERDGPARPDAPRRPAAGARPLRDARRGGPVRGPARDARSRDLLAADEAAARVKGIAFTESMLRRPARVEDVRRDRRQLDRAGHHPRRGAASRPTPSTATSTSAGATPTPAAAGGGGGYEFVRGLDLAERAEPLADEAVELLTAPQCPSGRFTIVLDPSQLYLQVHESLRPPDRARPRLRHRGVLRRHELPDDRQARRGLPLRLGPRRHRGRRDRARRDGHVRLGRRGRRRAGRAARPGRDLRRLPEQPRDGAADRAPERRRDAGRRLEPDPAHPDDQHQPAAEARDEPRRHRRRHRRRPLPRVQPLAGRSTTAGSTSSSRPRSPTRSRAARRAGCSRTRPTPGSPTSSGARATPSATSRAT